jgi:hypothetical protein
MHSTSLGHLWTPTNPWIVSATMDMQDLIGVRYNIHCSCVQPIVSPLARPWREPVVPPPATSSLALTISDDLLTLRCNPPPRTYHRLFLPHATLVTASAALNCALLIWLLGRSSTDYLILVGVLVYLALWPIAVRWVRAVLTEPQTVSRVLNIGKEKWAVRNCEPPTGKDAFALPEAAGRSSFLLGAKACSYSLLLCSCCHLPCCRPTGFGT